MESEKRSYQLWIRFDQYCLEVDFIAEKLRNGCIPQGKREKITYRLRDLQKRLIPQVVAQIQR